MRKTSPRAAWAFAPIVLAVSLATGCIFGNDGSGGADSEPLTAETVRERLKTGNWRGVIGETKDPDGDPVAGSMAEFNFLGQGTLKLFIGAIEVGGDWEVRGEEGGPFTVDATELGVQTCHLDDRLQCTIAELWANNYFENAGTVTLELSPTDRAPERLTATVPPASGDRPPGAIVGGIETDNRLAPQELEGTWAGEFQKNRMTKERSIEVFENSSGTVIVNSSLDGNEKFSGRIVTMEFDGKTYWGARDTSTKDEVPIVAGRVEFGDEGPVRLTYPEREGTVVELEPVD